MALKTVQNDMRKRVKAIRRMPDGIRYQAGWNVHHPSDRKRDEFIVHFEGSFQQAIDWMDDETCD